MHYVLNKYIANIYIHGKNFIDRRICVFYCFNFYPNKQANEAPNSQIYVKAPFHIDAQSWMENVFVVKKIQFIYMKYFWNFFGR